MTTTQLAPMTLNMTLAVTIRPSTVEDIPKLEMDGQFTHFRPMFRRSYRDQLAGRRLLIVADCNHMPVGRLFVLFKSQDPNMADGHTRAYLYSFFVHSLFRGQGIGSAMVNYAETILQARHYQRVIIAVAQENHGALRLYQRLHYRILRDDPGEWSYTDHVGQVHVVKEPCWILEKILMTR